MTLQRANGAPLAAAIALLLVVVSAAGCGGGKPPASVASLGTTATTTTSSAAGGGDPTSGAPGSQSHGGGAPGSHIVMAGGGSLEQLTRFAACMRKNGVPTFPDPDAQGRISLDGVNPQSAQFQHAQQACQRLLPDRGQPSPAQQAQIRSQALAFSACMRSHGVPRFPDPQFGTGGQVSIRIGEGVGINPRSRQFQAAQQACQKDVPGSVGGPKPSAGPSSR